MKRVLSISMLSLLSITWLSSCKKSNSPGTTNENITATASFTIDGDNFKKQAITIKGAAKTTTQCNYFPKDKMTLVTINDQPDITTEMKNQFFIVFNGDTPATQHSGDDTNGGTFNSVYFQVSVTDRDGALHAYLFENADNTPGVFTITQYGKIGEPVEGSFSGILVDEDGSPAIKISGGKFSITRGNDMN